MVRPRSKVTIDSLSIHPSFITPKQQNIKAHKITAQ